MAKLSLGFLSVDGLVSPQKRSHGYTCVPFISFQAKAAAFKAQQAKEKAEYAYKQAVANAESTRVEFESKFEAACEVMTSSYLSLCRP